MTLREEDFISPDLTKYQSMEALIKKVGMESISDEELMALHTFFLDVTEKLIALGPKFRLAEQETYRVFRELESYRRARREVQKDHLPQAKKLYKVAVRSGSGHKDLDSENEAEVPEIIEFQTEVERAAFVRGINMAADQLDGWIEGWIETEIVNDG